MSFKLILSSCEPVKVKVRVSILLKEFLKFINVLPHILISLILLKLLFKTSLRDKGKSFSLIIFYNIYIIKFTIEFKQ